MRLLRVILSISLLSSLLLASAALAVAIWPKILVNPYTLQIAAHYAATKGIWVKWKSLEVNVDSLSLLKKRLNVSADELCVDMPENQISGCGSDIKFSVAARLSGLVPKITELGPLEIRDLQWQYGKGKKTIQGALNLETGRQSEFEIQTRGNWTYRVFRISGRVNLPDQSRIALRAIINLIGNPEEQLHIKYFVDARYAKKKADLLAQLQGDVDPDRWSGKISARGDRWTEIFPRFQLENCEWNLMRSSQSDVKVQGSRFQMNCPVDVRIPIPPPSIQSIEVPSRLRAAVSLDLSTPSFPPSLNEKISGPIELKLDPVLAPLFQGEGSAHGNVEGVLSEFPRNWIANASVGVKLQVPQFEKVVSRLEKTEWAIPAPANVLHGHLQIEAQGNADLIQGQFPVHLVTRLQSKTQVLNLDGEGLLSVQGLINRPRPSFDFDLLLSDFQIQLPDLNWAAPPPLVPDGRFSPPQPAHVKRKKPTLFRYRIAIKTKPKHPARVRSNLAKGMIPIDLQVTLSDSEPLKGRVRIEGFPVEFLRRKARVEHFDLDLSSPLKESLIDGWVRVNYADYILQIHIYSTLNRPQIVLRSEPALPENQLVAALIFGKPLEELDPDQSASVGNTRAAITSGAVGLLSFYALASTPVQSVDFDPKTGKFSAKVRIAEGTSLNVGSATGLDSSTVGIRKRLGSFWTIETSLENSSAYGEVASAYLEWSHRY